MTGLIERMGTGWNDHVVPRLADRALSTGAVMRLRARAVTPLSGRVLEIGFGSGLNLGLLPAAVTSLDAVEPADVGWALSARARDAARVPVARVGLDGQHLDVADASYDAVLSTFSLCTIPDPALALAEVRRVLRPGGVFCWLEHGRSPDAGVQRWQARLEPVQRRVAGGCHLTRDVPGLVAGAGLEVASLDAAYLPGPGVARPWAWVTLGTARRSG